MPAKKEKVIKETKVIKGEKASLSVPSYSLDGKQSGSLDLPKELFGAEVNKPLLSQAMRVYSNNLTSHNSNTKTRSEVQGSTRKIFKQKGTGRARHGSIRAPIFVGGGIALGPKSRKVLLDLPKKMKQVALISALSVRAQEGEVIGLSNIDKASGKLKQIKQFITSQKKKNILFIIGENNEQIKRAVKNLSQVDAQDATQINVYQIIKHQTLMLTKEAVEKLEARINKEEVVKKEKGVDDLVVPTAKTAKVKSKLSK